VRLQVVRPMPFRFLVKNLADPITYANGLVAMLPHWFKGYSSAYAALYELDRNAAGNYLPDFFQYRITHATNRNVWPTLHDKLLFHLFMRDHLPVTPLLAFVSNGQHMDVDAHGGIDTWLGDLIGGTSMIVKPLQGGGGGGLTFLRAVGQDRVSTGHQELSGQALRSWFHALPYHGVYRHETQHPELERLYPQTTNTLRVHIFREPEGPTTILGAVVRVGVERSRPVDNFNQGALSVFVDPATGTTGEAISRGADGRPIRHTAHPETGAPLAGVTIPVWPRVVSELTAFHDAYPAFDLVGWDIIVTPTGYRVIEGNHNPNLRTTLVHQGIRSCPAFLEFCERRGLLGPLHRRSTGARGPW
jgi:hypothetical protein